MSIRMLFYFTAIFFITCSSFAQKHRYMVFFNDKSNSGYTLDNPEDFLTERALNRRLKMNITLDSLDLPVSQSYVDSLRQMNVDVFFSSKWMNAVLVQMDENQISSIKNLGFVSEIEFVAPDTKLKYTQSSEPLGSFKTPETNTATTNKQLNQVGLSKMHADSLTGKGVIIGVIDAGFPGVNEYKPFESIFKENRLLGTRDFIANSGNVFQYNNHGTAVLSIIGGKYESGFTGAAPDASFVLCVTEDVATEYRVEEYNWLLAAEYIDSIGADVINSSLGYSTFDTTIMDYKISDLDGKTAVVSKAAQIAADKGIVVVVSAGNTGTSKKWKYITSPADVKDAITVGSVNFEGDKTNFSSYGPTSDGRTKPDIMAMGENVCIFSGGHIKTGNGTSYASPLMAGFAANILQAKPTISNIEVIDFIRRCGSNATSPNDSTGYGIANYLNIAFDYITSTEPDLSNIRIFPNPLSENRLVIDFDDFKCKGDLNLMIYGADGRVIVQKNYDSGDLMNRLDIELSSMNTGIYFLKLSSKNLDQTFKLKKL